MYAEELKEIKKIYGEEMMHLCRSLFPTILNEPGRLLELLKELFYPSKFLAEDIIANKLEISFQNYVYSFFFKNKDEESSSTVKQSPKELLARVGYKLYECHNDDEINAFKRYYIEKELLCTFTGSRLERCFVFFAVRDDADKLIRENFTDPKREDEYGTSVISIQFTRGEVNTLSIKNRYNHTVDCPDSTFSNQLDKIVYGLTSAFEREYGLSINKYNKCNFEIPGYVLANDGKYYKYNYEINNIYYCSNNIIIDNFDVKKDYSYEKERYLFLDYFILDLKEKRIIKYDNNINDSFIDDFVDIKKISINNQRNGNKEVIITKENNDKIFITLDKYSRIIKYCNDSVKKIGDNFLSKNKVLEEFRASNVQEIGNNFLDENNTITSIDLSNVLKIGNHFLDKNNSLLQINLPNVLKIGFCFLSLNEILTDIYLPNVMELGDAFLCFDRALTHIELPNVLKIGNAFLKHNRILKHIIVTKLKEAGMEFLAENKELESIELLNMEIINRYFMGANNKIEVMLLPKLKKLCSDFLNSDEALKRILVPKDAFVSENLINKYGSIIEYIYEEVLADDRASHI